MGRQDLPDLKRARTLWARDRHDEALELFARCAREHPKNPYALTDAARVHGQWFEFEAMEDYVARLLDLSANRNQNRLQAGMTYRMNYRPQKAIEHLRPAASSKETAFLAALELAVIYERLGDLEQTQDFARGALRIVRRSPEATLVLSRALNRQGQSDEAQRLLAGISARPASPISPDTLAAALALRARIHEQRGQYTEAFSLAEQSNRTLRPLAKHLPPKATDKTDEITKLFDTLTRRHVEQLLAWSDSKQRAKVCLMTSYPRSGATLLESMLGAHPDVVAADELPVFSMRVVQPLVAQCGGSPAEAPQRLLSLSDQWLDEYRTTYLNAHAQTLETTLNGRLLLDKNPSLTVFLPLFLRLLPEVKLLVPLRDPRDVVLSCFFQYLPVNWVSVSFLDLRSAAQNFAKLMGHWVGLRRLLPEDSWCEVRYEDLVASPRQELARTLEFLGLPWHADTLSYFERDKVTVHNAPTYADVKQPPHQKSVGRWENYAEHFVPLRPILEPIMNKLGYHW